jgi:hypothetical protein
VEEIDWQWFWSVVISESNHTSWEHYFPTSLFFFYIFLLKITKKEDNGGGVGFWNMKKSVLLLLCIFNGINMS